MINDFERRNASSSVISNLYFIIIWIKIENLTPSVGELFTNCSPIAVKTLANCDQVTASSLAIANSVCTVNGTSKNLKRTRTH